ESLPPDTAVLSAHHPDYAGGSAAISNGSAHIVLARGGDIEGYVRVGGQPAAGVSLSAISVDGAGRQSARTDDNGFYVLKALPPGLIQVRGHYGGGGGGRNLEQQAVVEEDKVTEVNFDIAAGTATVAGAVQIENVPAGSIRVTLSVASGSGTEEMTAQVQERDGAYSYSIEGVPAGACTLAAQVYTHNSLRSAAPITLEVRDGQAVRQDIVFPVGGTVRGEVTGPLADSESGVAVLRGADPLPVLDLMSLERLFKERTLGGVQVTAENPSFIIQNIEPGTHTVVVFAIPRDVSSELEALANVRIATAHVEVRENEESRVDLRLP
ncbi:MAG TPA: carboxypeptidase regulatory-like domain-containing protein, partial [Candidatus Hydrogenedentes bacterium]|nr:carboxypeptidase regulatory-like domain-containing protein [Candidatus Hydrogenedentota bacterium]